MSYNYMQNVQPIQIGSVIAAVSCAPCQQGIAYFHFLPFFHGILAQPKILFNSALYGVRKGGREVLYGWVSLGREYQNYYCWMNPKVSKNSFFNLPSLGSFPDINQSLKLINTVNNFPQHSSFENMELAVVGTATGEAAADAGEDSLGQRISHVPTAPNSAKKKRTGCTCKKTFCLKMYCECFSSDRVCGDDCACKGCKNTSQYRSEVSQAKLAAKERGTRNSSLSDKRCTCKKTGCLKRYCECYNAGVGCSEACKCQGCKNVDLPPAAEQAPVGSSEEGVQVKAQLGVVVEVQGEVGFPSMKKYSSVDDFQKYYD